jgi:hypothetical protein
MNLSELLDVVYRFYPRGWSVESPGYDNTPERGRQLDAVQIARSEYPKWEAMLDRLRARFDLQDRSSYLFGSGFDSAYLATIIFTSQGQEYGLGFHVSILGPHYVVHRMGRPDEEPYAQAVAQEIEATYRGYEPIPPEIGDVVVPDITLDAKNFGQATVFDCLLSAQGGGRSPGDSRSPLPWNCPPVGDPPEGHRGDPPREASKGTFRITLDPRKPGR